MIRATSDGDGVRVPVRAQPRASRDAVAGEHNGALKIAVTSSAEGGRANKAIAAVLAKALGVRPSAVTLVSGHTSRTKTFHVAGCTPADVEALL